ncbi:hydroxyacid dehydrogenase [Streptomyces sp. NBC_00038]|uniref:hydroxyacid dehydrogenase n=1 Tax=Streptomyces sp. NBC_00038 TaxID=2903615 RepID=UPI00225AB913|nr:hydroxyacid dehydrogenase [Streptomyces sp. NBC_00038]MCX5562549.1 hydroxyacid dehydrogenase [Streptomyces sp. NBC_00038]
MSRRMTVAIAMQPEVAALALTEELTARLDKSVDVRPGIIVDFATPASRSRLADVDVLLTGWGCPLVDHSVLDAAPRLRAIVHAAGSVKQHLTPEVWRRGILVSSAASANAFPVAQYTVGAILLAGKRAFRLAHDYTQGRYKNKLADDTGNHERVVGIVGASRTGRLVLELLAPHGFRLLVSDPTLDARAAAGLHPAGQVELVDLDELLGHSDIVSLHAPALPETHHLLDDRRLALLRDGAVLINTARGQLIDTEALFRHCADGRIDAVLDVTDPEPLPAGHPLLSLPNVMVTPHVAGAMGTEIRRLGEFAVTEIERLSVDEPLHGGIHADQLALLA